MNLRRAGILLLVSGLPVAGCRCVWGFEEPSLIETGGTAGAGGSGGQGAGGSGAGGSGGTGGTGGPGCTAGEIQPCYSGPEGTVEVGICSSGEQTCSTDGVWGACDGQVLPAVETCREKTDEDCDGIDCVRWAVVFGDESEQMPLDVATDDAGFIYLLGAFAGTLDFGDDALIAGGGTDLFLVKLDSTGKHIWSKQYANPSLADPPEGFLADLDVRGDGSIVLALPFASSIDLGTGKLMSEGFSDIAVARLDTEGNTLWSKRFGGVGIDALAGVGFTKDGSVLLSGSFAFTIDFGGEPLQSAGGKDGYLAKLIADTGDHVWSTKIGGSANQNIEAQAVDSAGSVTVSGSFSGDTVVCGKTLVVQSPDRDLFAARFDGDTGGCEWVNQYTGTGTYAVKRGVVDALGGVTIAGLLDGTLNFEAGSIVSAGPSSVFDVFLFKVSATDGQYQWSKSFQSPGADDAVGALVADGQKNLLFSLQSNGTVNFEGATLASAGGQDIFLGGLATGGAYLWARGFGDEADQSAPQIALFPDGDILLAARVSGVVDLGGGSIPTKGADLLLARLAP